MFQQRNLYQVLFRILNSFSNSIRYFVCFAQAVANHTVAVTDDNNSGKAKTPTTFHHLCNAIDSYHAFLQV